MSGFISFGSERVTKQNKANSSDRDVRSLTATGVARVTGVRISRSEPLTPEDLQHLVSHSGSRTKR